VKKMAVWKFVVPIEDQPVLRMPRGARIISAAFQHPDVCIWALVDTKAPVEDRPLSVRGTGHPADGLAHVPFIGTVAYPMSLVFHIWDGVPA